MADFGHLTEPIGELSEVRHVLERQPQQRGRSGLQAEFAITYGFAVRWCAGDGPTPRRGLAFGPTVRSADVTHAVAIVDGRVWDPHPSRVGLTSVSTYVDWVPVESRALRSRVDDTAAGAPNQGGGK